MFNLMTRRRALISDNVYSRAEYDEGGYYSEVEETEHTLNPLPTLFTKSLFGAWALRCFTILFYLRSHLFP